MKSIDPFTMSSLFNTLPNGDYDICKLCAAKIATRKNGSTHGNMQRHLKSKHPDRVCKSQTLHEYMNSNKPFKTMLSNMEKMTKRNKTQSLAKYMNSASSSLKKISEQCKVGSIYTVEESVLQSTRFGDILIVGLTTNDHNKVIKTFLPSSTVQKLKNFHQENGLEELGNDSIVGAVFKYIGLGETKAGYKYPILEWLKDEDISLLDI